ncbi:RNA polymerase subunit sigma-70 [Microlunatus parietis]|uniref:RNA polymerase sigma-70 factor (ECF subfamily) n=1 Tax=Microlunatus parietis TaxID=682979 RepID=A0A7Y9IDJ0_9ACTN|nr:RNA polymerase subunit sigma-70 [Microlunatus parietis]NYE74892.1 RNA polymerase sigma-70 factor (ECF subfamily) [Microlunatus parietis]
MTAATVPALTDAEFEREFEALRSALLAHCYRMVGSYHDAEDLVQETYLRARRGIGDFEGRSSVKTWLYRIATNACLTALQHHSRRFLPSGLGAPSGDPDAPVGTDSTVAWLEPLPDAALGRSGGDPAAEVVERDTVRLALIVAFQHLAPRQRAALLLREVLGWPAAEIAAAMGIGVAAVKSLLQRARVRIAEVRADQEIAEPPDSARDRELLDRWISAFERADVRDLESLISSDFSLEAAGHTTWFRGLAVCLPFLARRQFRPAGQLRMLPTRANGQPAAAGYLRQPDGSYRADHLTVLTIAGGKIIKVTNFLGERPVRDTGLPATMIGNRP